MARDRVKIESHRNIGGYSLKVEHDLHVYQTLAQLSVDSAQEVERQRQLEDELIDHDEISNSHRSCGELLKCEYGSPLTIP
jgi:hypothetical protein